MVKVKVRGEGMHYTNECPQNYRNTSMCVYLCVRVCAYYNKVTEFAVCVVKKTEREKRECSTFSLLLGHTYLNCRTVPRLRGARWPRVTSHVRAGGWGSGDGHLSGRSSVFSSTGAVLHLNPTCCASRSGHTGAAGGGGGDREEVDSRHRRPVPPPTSSRSCPLDEVEDEEKEKEKCRPRMNRKIPESFHLIPSFQSARTLCSSPALARNKKSQPTRYFFFFFSFLLLFVTLPQSVSSNTNGQKSAGNSPATPSVGGVEVGGGEIKNIRIRDGLYRQWSKMATLLRRRSSSGGREREEEKKKSLRWLDLKEARRHVEGGNVDGERADGWLRVHRGGSEGGRQEISGDATTSRPGPASAPRLLTSGLFRFFFFFFSFFNTDIISAAVYSITVNVCWVTRVVHHATFDSCNSSGLFEATCKLSRYYYRYRADSYWGGRVGGGGGGEGAV